MNDLLAVVAEMRDTNRHEGLQDAKAAPWQYAIQDWADRLESLAPAGLSDGEREALEKCERDIDDPAFNLVGRVQFKRVFAALRRLAAAPAVATQQTGAVACGTLFLRPGDKDAPPYPPDYTSPGARVDDAKIAAAFDQAIKEYEYWRGSPAARSVAITTLTAALAGETK